MGFYYLFAFLHFYMNFLKGTVQHYEKNIYLLSCRQLDEKMDINLTYLSQDVVSLA